LGGVEKRDGGRIPRGSGQENRDAEKRKGLLYVFKLCPEGRARVSDCLINWNGFQRINDGRTIKEKGSEKKAAIP